MKHSILTFITIFSLVLLMNCGGEKGKEKAGTENAETTKTEALQGRLDKIKPCEWISTDFVKSTLELGDDSKIKTTDTFSVIFAYGCLYCSWGAGLRAVSALDKCCVIYCFQYSCRLSRWTNGNARRTSVKQKKQSSLNLPEYLLIRGFFLRSMRSRD